MIKLIRSIKKDGLLYAILDYSDFNDLDDAKFHKLKIDCREKPTKKNFNKMRNHLLEKFPELDGYMSFDVTNRKYDKHNEFVLRQHGNAKLLEEILIQELYSTYGFRGTNELSLECLKEKSMQCILDEFVEFNKIQNSAKSFKDYIEYLQCQKN